MKMKTGFLLALLLAAGVRADETIVRWGEPGAGATNVATAPLALSSVPTTYSPATVSCPPVGKNYYPKSSGRSPVFNATANNSPVAVISVEFPGAAAQINIGTGETNFQQMVVWDEFLTSNTTLTSLSLRLFPYGPTFTNGTSSFLLQKTTGQWYASAPVSLIKTNYTDSTPIDPSTLTWHEFTPITNGVAVIGEMAPIDMTGVQTVGYYSDLNGGKGYIGTYTAYFEAKAASGLTSSGDEQAR